MCRFSARSLYCMHVNCNPFLAREITTELNKMKEIEDEEMSTGKLSFSSAQSILVCFELCCVLFLFVLYMRSRIAVVGVSILSIRLIRG